MEPVSFTFYNLNFIINPFQFSGMNGVLAVIQDAITISVKHIGKGVHRLVVEVLIDSPELIYELPATERETLEARMDEALSVL